ncbi:MAG: hypothetical protein RIQ56_562, partial [Candidatus Parcubacteria bacterium]
MKKATFTLHIFAVALVVGILLLPLLSSATSHEDTSTAAPYAFRSQGVFGCNMNGAYSMSVGTMSAVGGVYVPVNDAAVTLNTGFLVYKECVLRQVVDAERMAAAAAIEKNLQVSFVQGNGGRGSFPKVFSTMRIERMDPDALYFLQNRLNSLPPALSSSVKRALAQNYIAETRNYQNEYTCPYKGDLAKALSGEDTSPEAVLATFDSRCDPMFAYLHAKEARDSYLARGQGELLTRLGWNNGVFDVEEVDSNNQHITLTPGTLVRDSASAAVQSGMTQLRMANDVGQMTGALYAALSSQIVSDSRGLAGTLRGVGGQPSYLDQVVAEQSANVRNTAVNAALQILAAAKQIETNYLQVVTNIANILTQTIRQLRDVENQCWAFIIQKTCTSAPAADGTCTAPAGERLRIATSTYQYAQSVISSQVQPLAGPAITNVTN